MIVENLFIKGVILIKPRIFSDQRGYFFEAFHVERYKEAGIDVEFVQDNESFSIKNVIRGLHFQKKPYSQAKLVRVIQGKILDVVVDLRRNSPTFGKYIMVELSAENNYQLFIPSGMAHGFVTLDEFNRVHYKCSAYYHPEAERTILWNDPELAIPWPVSNPIISEKDAKGILFNQAFDDYF
ncbi:MAG: dTDP-4-dehydrorhamnose 3,5-epimerase [Bacteroidales bacterium]|nr:dTDP-4-dehydrorhamnose 3,5-epimerase [Bacteroidales bacterium]